MAETHDGISGTSSDIMSKLIWIDSSLNMLARPTAVVVNTVTVTNTDDNGKIMMTDRATMMPEPSQHNSTGSGAVGNPRRLTVSTDDVQKTSGRSSGESGGGGAPLDVSRRLTGESKNVDRNSAERSVAKTLPAEDTAYENAVEPAVPIAKIVKCAERLMVVLEELRVDLPSANEHCDSVIDLINKVHWFLKDLSQTSASCDQTQILLEKYNNYRKAYYCLRNHMTDMKQLCDRCNIARQPQVVDDCSEAEQDNSDNACDVVSVYSSDHYPKTNVPKSDGSLKGLYECPGLLDVTKNNDIQDACGGLKERAEDKQRKWEKFDWMALVKDACCFCFPRQCFVFCSVK